jgi:hypothetical protein
MIINILVSITLVSMIIVLKKRKVRKIGSEENIELFMFRLEFKINY